jgi:hypothetical protein
MGSFQMIKMSYDVSFYRILEFFKKNPEKI